MKAMELNNGGRRLQSTEDLDSGAVMRSSADVKESDSEQTGQPDDLTDQDEGPSLVVLLLIVVVFGTILFFCYSRCRSNSTTSSAATCYSGCMSTFLFVLTMVVVCALLAAIGDAAVDWYPNELIVGRVPLFVHLLVLQLFLVTISIAVTFICVKNSKRCCGFRCLQLLFVAGSLATPSMIVWAAMLLVGSNDVELLESLGVLLGSLIACSFAVFGVLIFSWALFCCFEKYYKVSLRRKDFCFDTVAHTYIWLMMMFPITIVILFLLLLACCADAQKKEG